MFVQVWRISWIMLMVTCFETGRSEEDSENEDSVLYTPGCEIPQFNMSFRDDKKKQDCGIRQILIPKVADNKIQFIYRKPFKSCCFKYVLRSNEPNFEDWKIRYSECRPMKNRGTAPLLYDFIYVQCKENAEVLYEDYYCFTKQTKIKAEAEYNPPHTANNYNVLVIGIDAMSRSRAYESLPETVNYLNKNEWLDYRGYNQVGKDTVNNIMALLTGSSDRIQDLGDCAKDMSKLECNELFIWQEFQDRGYVTAYGEDLTFKNGAFHEDSKGFQTPPTDHYMRPLFLSTEADTNARPCAKRILSGMQILKYILDLSKTYRKKKYFGFFWIKSLTHGQSPKQYDTELKTFMMMLKENRVLRNTFVFFLSAHGIKKGPLRLSTASHYDERLPMLFIHVPHVLWPSLIYDNFITNQHRLTSAYDVYLTIWDILKLSTGETIVPKANDCSNCMSFFRMMPEQRSCADAGIRDEFCTCHDLKETNSSEYGAMYSAVLALEHIRNLSSTIPTIACTQCREFQVQGKILRVHSFSHDDVGMNYVILFVISPGDVTFEATVKKVPDHEWKHFTYKVTLLQLISPLKTQCTVYKKDTDYCVCDEVDC